MHFLVWVRRRSGWAHLLFALSATGVAAYTGCELWMMRAETPGEFGVALRWAHVPVWVVVVSLVAFTRSYLRAGRLSLAWAAFGVRTLALLLNFGPAPNLNYREISALRHFRFLGETVASGEGASNPWRLVGPLSLVFLLLFVTDASLAAWRRGDRRQALLVGGSIALFALGATLESALVLGGGVHVPLTASLFYLGLVAAMGYQLSDDVLRAGSLSDDLREREQQMALVADAAGLGLWVWTMPQDTVWATERLNAILGFEPGEPISIVSFLGHVYPEDREPTRRALQRALDERADYWAEYRVVLPDGRHRWIAAHGRVQRPERNAALRMLGVCIDITVRKENEVEMAKLRAELTHVGRLSSMAQLASGLAHELNQPLGAILRNAEAAELLLQASPPDLEEVRAILADICKDDHRAGEVIDHMRALLKRRGLERVELQVADLVDEVLVLVQPDAASRQVRLGVEVPRALPAVRGDRVQLQQVLLNLILNGMDAMADVPAEGRRLVVRARQADPGTVEVAIADRGHGVAAEKLERLFEPFFTTKPDGMGLGLPISATIIGAHGGRLWADSGPTGATFCFTLPVSGGA
jgi:two-component system sensor kinase FixL